MPIELPYIQGILILKNVSGEWSNVYRNMKNRVFIAGEWNLGESLQLFPLTSEVNVQYFNLIVRVCSLI